MKIRRIYAIATILALAIAIAAPSATAQSGGLKVSIPFEFYAAGKLFPAGAYTLSKKSGSDTLRLHNARGESVYILAGRQHANPEDRNWITFHQYGGRSFLASAYWAGSGASLKVPVSRAEQEIARTEGEPNPITLASK